MNAKFRTLVNRLVAMIAHAIVSIPGLRQAVEKELAPDPHEQYVRDFTLWLGGQMGMHFDESLEGATS